LYFWLDYIPYRASVSSREQPGVDLSFAEADAALAWLGEPPVRGHPDGQIEPDWLPEMAVPDSRAGRVR